MKNNSKITQKIDKKSKKYSEDQKNTQNINPKIKSFLYIGGVVIAILLLAFGISFYQNSLRLNNYQNVLEGVYRSSYFNMVDKVNSVSIDAEKLSTASTEDAQLVALRNISKDSESIVASLSLLSIDSHNVVDLTRFFNQLGGLADAFTDKIYHGESLTEQDIEQINRVCGSLNNVKGILNPHNESITTGEYMFTSQSVMKNGKSPFSVSLGDMTAENMDYPSMIFDGPFSASLEKKHVKGLPDDTISAVEAEKKLRDKVFTGKKIEILSRNETKADLQSYNFEVKQLERKFFVQISKRGGILLTMSGEIISANPKIDDDKAKELAEDYARVLGFENIKTVWQETHDNISYINMAPVVDGCIYYPDLIKAKVDKTSGDIVGWDAQNYAYNHINRIVNVVITEEEARSSLNTNEQVDASSLVIIPTDDGKEQTAYEFKAQRTDGEYYVYVSAETGKIIKTMKEVSTDKVHKLI